MGYAMMIGRCINCGNRITFNPAKVPSIRHPKTGDKEPLCEACFNKWNEIHRTSKGLAPIPLQPDAYTYCNEAELLNEDLT